MSFEYSKLAGKIKEIFDTQGKFATAMCLSERSLSMKLSNQRGWKQNEIKKACTLLGIPREEIHDYFFAEKVH